MVAQMPMTLMMQDKERDKLDRERWQTKVHKNEATNRRIKERQSWLAAK
jgi:hypothetical protein